MVGPCPFVLYWYCYGSLDYLGILINRKMQRALLHAVEKQVTQQLKKQHKEHKVTL